MEIKDKIIRYSVNKSHIGKLPRGANWGKFHNQWAQEWGTPHTLASDIYRGYSFAPLFNGRKVWDSFWQSWHIALDFDDGNESIDKLMSYDIVNFFSSFIYYTPSSKPPHYRSRVVFIFDNPILSADQFEEITNAFAWLFPTSDQSTTDAARFFYGSQKCKLHGIWSILPVDSAMEIVKQWKDSKPAKVKSNRIVIRPAAPKSEEEDIINALKYIPQQTTYSEWLSILMAVHSVLPGQRGIDICESWSVGYDGEIENKFKSFKRSGGKTVSINTLFKMAIDKGWKPKNRRVNKLDIRYAL